MKRDAGKIENTTICLAFICVVLTGDTFAQSSADADNFQLTTPSSCSNNKGEAIRFIDTDRSRRKIAAGMARRDEDGNPVIFRSHFKTIPPHFQHFITAHECAHHQTGDVDQPHPQRNGQAHLMKESISDCIAILRMREADGETAEIFNKYAATMRTEMEKIGFPPISVDSRIANIKTCFFQYGPADEYVAKVLARRDQ